jgi:hypothetical protein
LYDGGDISTSNDGFGSDNWLGSDHWLSWLEELDNFADCLAHGNRDRRPIAPIAAQPSQLSQVLVLKPKPGVGCRSSGSELCLSRGRYARVTAPAYFARFCGSDRSATRTSSAALRCASVSPCMIRNLKIVSIFVRINALICMSLLRPGPIQQLLQRERSLHLQEPRGDHQVPQAVRGLEEHRHVDHGPYVEQAD